MKNSILLFLATVVSLMAYGADPQPDDYNETYKTMTISMREDLTWLASQVNNGINYDGWTITLGKDLDMSGVDFTPIGNSKTCLFNGHFNGNNKTISNLAITGGNGVSYIALFGYTGEEAIIESLTLESSCAINGKNTVVGSIVGNNNGTISQCTNKASVSSTSQYCGGIVGTNKGTVSGCTNYGNVSGKNNVGGITGTNSTGTTSIVNCTNYGTILSQTGYAGGIVGNYQSGTINGNYTYGDVTTTNAEKNTFHTGAIIGSYDGVNSINNNYYDMCVTVTVNSYVYSFESNTGCAVGESSYARDIDNKATCQREVSIPAYLVDGFGWATYYNSAANMLADEGTTVYTAKLSGDGETLALTKVADRIIKKGQGVILKRSGKGSFLLTATSAAATDSYFASNVLTGVDASTAQATGLEYFVLGTGSNDLGFYKLSSGINLGSHKAFVVLAAGGHVRAMLLDDSQAAAIGEVTTTEATQPATYTDLLGRKVATPRKGIYMVNGKKTVVR